MGDEAPHAPTASVDPMGQGSTRGSDNSDKSNNDEADHIGGLASLVVAQNGSAAVQDLAPPKNSREPRPEEAPHAPAVSVVPAGQGTTHGSGNSEQTSNEEVDLAGIETVAGPIPGSWLNMT